MPANRWQRALPGGRAALAPKGAAGGARCKLAAADLGELETVPDARPAGCGYEDQCWTLARIAGLVRERFAAEYTLARLDLLRYRPGAASGVDLHRNRIAR